MPKVSVIVPLYNQRDYLQRFMDSLSAQTLEDFEVVLVDDASTDGSKDIALGREGNDARFRVIAHESNRGAGAARNTGIAAACGETLCFADPDDFLPENSLAVRYAAYKQHNAIVRACHAEADSEGYVISEEKRPHSLPEVFCPAKDAGKTGANPFLCAHWTWLFPTKLLQRLGITSPEGTKTAEDIRFLVRLFFHASRVVWIPDTVYYWIKRSGSLSTTRYTAKHYIDYFHCVDEFYAHAAKAGALDLADRFCDEYLTVYLAHLCGQVSNGSSSAEEVYPILATAFATCTRFNTFARLQSGKLAQSQSLGIQWLHDAGQGSAPLSVTNLLEGYSAFLSSVTRLRYSLIQQAGWEHTVRFDRLESESGLVRGRYLFHGQHPDEQCLCDGQPVLPVYSKNRLVPEGEGMGIYERILWLPLPEHAEGKIELSVGGRTVVVDAIAT